MSNKKEFMLLQKDFSKLPHKFACFKYNSKYEQQWKHMVKRCLQSWRLTANVYRLENTGFDKSNISFILNKLGKERLPETPIEDENITKNPYITDIVEILSMKLIENQHSDVVFPYPRVLHKELEGNQHKGIDLLGYVNGNSGYILVVVEVMASVQDKYPADTVRDHLKQILDQTLADEKSNRLLKELEYIHDEAENEHKDILNNFLFDIHHNLLNSKDRVWAIPILVRPKNKWRNGEWDPFISKTKHFEKAAIPSTLFYYAIKCDCSFSELMDKVKKSACGNEIKENKNV